MTHHEVIRTLAGMPWLTIRTCRDVPERGRYYPEHEVVLLRSGLTGPQWASTAMHEAIHAERRDRPCATSWHEAKQERVVELETARRLLGLEPLADALAWAQDEWEVADEIHVDVETVRTRIDALTLAEREFIEARIKAKGEVA